MHSRNGFHPMSTIELANTSQSQYSNYNLQASQCRSLGPFKLGMRFMQGFTPYKLSAALVTSNFSRPVYLESAFKETPWDAKAGGNGETAVTAVTTGYTKEQ